MKTTVTYRVRKCRQAMVLLFTGLLLVLPGTTSSAQIDRMMDTITKDVKVDQKLHNQIDLSLPFTNEQGEEVLLGEYFGSGKPVILTLVYYGCPMLCGQILEGTTRAIKKTDLEIGEDYSVLSISFDHTEEYDLARKKKATYVTRMNREGTEKGWHFLVSDSASVAQLAEQVGFRYFKDEESRQYGHSATIIVLTPTGRVSRYFFGVDYDPRDLQLGLVEASDEQIGTIADELLLLCFQYNPETGSYGFAIMGAIRIVGTLVLILMVGFIVRSMRKDRKKDNSAASPGIAGT